MKQAYTFDYGYNFNDKVDPDDLRLKPEQFNQNKIEMETEGLIRAYDFRTRLFALSLTTHLRNQVWHLGRTKSTGLGKTN